MLSDLAAAKSTLAKHRPSVVEKPGVMETAVALILTPGERGLEALFIRRAERPDDPWSGHIALPGGRREPADADRLATAIRETREEVGLELPAAALLGALDDLHPLTPRLPPLVIRPYVFGFARRPEARLSEEVAGVMWLPLGELAAAAGKTSVQIRGVSTEVECFNTGDVVVWGLTYRIVSGFLRLAA